MRAFISILFALALVFQSATHAHAIQPPCPMEHSGGAADVDVTTNGPHGDCCSDADTVAKAGKLCKIGAECQSTSVCLLVANVRPLVVVDASASPRFVERLDPIDTPRSVWRPPALT